MPCSPPPVWTGPVVLTLVLAVLALVASIGAIVSQVVMWRRGGPRVKLSVREAVTFGPIGTASFIAMEATNVGRVETSVGGFSLQVGEAKAGKTLVGFESWPMPVELPVSLKPGESVTWGLNPVEVARTLVEKGLTRMPLRGRVRFGHGATTVPVPESAATLITGHFPK